MKNNRDYLKKMKTTNIKIVSDHVYCLSTNIDTKLLEKVCWEKHDFLEEVLDENNDHYVDNSFVAPITSRCYNQYNLLTLITPPLHSVYTNIRDLFRNIVPDKPNYFIQCWLNIFNDKSPYLDWHRHFYNEKDAYHGFLVVKSDVSYTEFRKADKSTFTIDSYDGLLAISSSYEDEHRTSPIRLGKIRITISFDIINTKLLDKYGYDMNHWLPI